MEKTKLKIKLRHQFKSQHEIKPETILQKFKIKLSDKFINLEEKFKQHRILRNSKPLMKCVAKDCNTDAHFADIETKIRLYCDKHSPTTYKNMGTNICIFSGCTRECVFGLKNSKKRLYCSEHIPDENKKDYENLASKKCINCGKKSAYFAIKEQKTPLYCKDCKDYNGINTTYSTKNVLCKNSEIKCYNRALYAKIGTRTRELCRDHIPDNGSYFLVTDNPCKDPNCQKNASFNFKGLKKGIYCFTHKLTGQINVVCDRCQSCDIVASFGFKNTKKSLFCRTHKLPEHVDLRSTKCKNCFKQAYYGKINGKKKAEYCYQHCPRTGYKDVRHRQCQEEGCDTQPFYGILGFGSTYCAEHAKSNMMRNSLVNCWICKTTRATKIFIDSNKIKTELDRKTAQDVGEIYFCETHAPKDSNDICNTCVICQTVTTSESDNHICLTCTETIKDGKTIKRKLKELVVKQKLEDANIRVELYDQSIPNGCSNRRPDFVIPCKWGYIVLEVDEFQHNRKSYTKDCEIARMCQIYMDVGTEKLLFIRYNPDSYIGTQYTQQQKLNFLLKDINYYVNLDIENKVEIPLDSLSVLYLFYDEFSDTQPKIETYNPYLIVNK